MRLPKAVGDPVVVYEGPYPNKTVLRQDFLFPDGRTRDFYLWGKLGHRSVVIFSITESGMVIATKQWRPGSDGCVYEFPGGNPDPGQSEQDCISQEMLEEVGYKPGEVIKLPEFWLEPPAFRVVIVSFLALNCRKVGEPEPEASEIIQKIEVPLSEWMRMMTNDLEGKDAKTLAVTLLALPVLLQRGLVSCGMFL